MSVEYVLKVYKFFLFDKMARCPDGPDDDDFKSRSPLASGFTKTSVFKPSLGPGFFLFQPFITPH